MKCDGGRNSGSSRRALLTSYGIKPIQTQRRKLQMARLSKRPAPVHWASINRPALRGRPPLVPITKRTQFSYQAPMTSLKQIEANRRNALKSTGPTSEDGKQRASRNAI